MAQYKEIGEIKAILAKSDYEYDHETPDKLRSKEFGRAYRRLVKKQLKPLGLELAKFGTNWCECSGFVTDGNGKYVYFHSGDYRWSNIWEGVLIRTAESLKDYRGGANHLCDIDKIGETAALLMGR